MTRILFVEDNNDDSDLIQRELRRAVPDVEVLRVQTREVFDASLREFAPDIVISDHRLPGFSGEEALELTMQGAPHVPFLLVTGSLDEETAVTYMRNGAADYLLKDRITRLGPAVAGALEQARQRLTLHRQQELLRQVLDANPSLVFVKDQEGRFVLANQATAFMYGTTVDQLMGKTEAELNPNAEGIERFVEDDRQVSESGKRKVILQEPRTNPATGETRWFHTIKVPLPVAVGRPRAILGVSTDITERRELEAQFEQAQKMEAVGRLAGGVAHDFNNILTIILSFTTFLSGSFEDGDERISDVDEISAAAKRAASLTRQLLAFSRKQILQPRVLDLNEVVTHMGGMLGRLIGEDIDLSTTLAPDLWPVLADPGQMEQVLMNLVVNARDAMAGGGKMQIETANEEVDQETARNVPLDPGQYVTLLVSDSGAGMDEITKARIFEPFFTTKGSGKGTGLGLSTVYGIVKQSGGFIWVSSEVGHGTTFRISLPRSPVTVTEESEDAMRSVVGGTETVLVVEDEPGVRALTRRILELYGYTVIECSSAADAKQAAMENVSVDLLLADMVLPDCSGSELADRLRAQWPSLAVLYMSGYTDDVIVHRRLGDSDSAFLQKPFTPDALAQRVRHALDMKGKAEEQSDEPQYALDHRG